MLRLGLPLIVLLAVAVPVTAAEPHFIVLPGIEGPSPCVRGIIAGLRKTHPAATYEVYDWTTGHAYRMLYHVRGWERNQVVAVQLAQHITTLQAERPDRPIVLVGHSGGGAMSVLALEQLPPGVQIQQAILLAPDLSPTHNLSTALERTTYGIDVFHSPLDFVILGAATVAVGTVDRAHLPGAGMTGFINTRSTYSSIYAAKLHQHGYDVAMITSGHFGGHFTCTLPEFVSNYVSPVVK